MHAGRRAGGQNSLFPVNARLAGRSQAARAAGRLALQTAPLRDGGWCLTAALLEKHEVKNYMGYIRRLLGPN